MSEAKSMSKSTECVEQSLELVEWRDVDGTGIPEPVYRLKVKQTSVSEPTGEPVADRFQFYNHIVLKLAEAGCKLSEQQKTVLCNLKALTTPQQRKPLTDEQIDEIIDSPADVRALITDWRGKLFLFARAIEAAHGIQSGTDVKE